LVDREICGTPWPPGTFPRITALESVMRYLLSFAVFAAFAFLAPAFAADALPAGVKPYPLTICIISDEPLDGHGEPVSKIYETQEVKFCCKPCIRKFDKDVAGNLKKIADQAGKKPAGKK